VSKVPFSRNEELTRLLEHKFDIAQLRVTEGAGRDPAKVCLNGTRVDVLSKMRKWIHGLEGADARLLLLVGQAGVGKSAITHSIANEYAKLGRLGAMFCFSKDRGSEHFFRTIARNLADMDHLYAAALSASITLDTATSPYPEIQMKDLLLAAFESLSVLGPIVIVIDALDECSDPDPIVDCLNQNIHSFPPNIRIVMSSRPSEAQGLMEYDWVKVYDLEKESARDEDIFLYVQEQLQGARPRKKASGLKAEDLMSIVSASEGLFQYASTLCKEIVSAVKHRNRTRESPMQTFNRLVKDGKGGLDALYTSILENLYGEPNGEDNSIHGQDALQVFRQVVGWILVAQHRLSHSSLVDFGRAIYVSNPEEDGYDAVSNVLQPLGALFSGTQSPSATVYPLHSSIRNFLLDSKRSKRFCVGSGADQHASMASVSFRLMVSTLRFNIANLESSYVLNEDVPDFNQRVLSSVPRSLLYASTHWGTHLSLSTCSSVQFEGISDIVTLYNEKILFWLEVLGLERTVMSAETTSQFLLQWLQVSADKNEHDHEHVYELTFIRGVHF